jgi:replication factor C subunit 3/5
VSQDSLPLSELLRPKRINELALPEKTIVGLQRMFDDETPENMLFFGPPGSGKTSTARIFTEQRGVYGSLNVDGSNETGINTMRTVVEGFATSCAFTPGIKICVIDDADFLSKSAQASLRGLIERVSANCRFILTVNDIAKIDPAVRSRLLCINFGISKADSPDILRRVQERTSQRLVALGFSFDEERLNQIVSENLSDLRRAANKLGFEFRRQYVPFGTEND